MINSPIDAQAINDYIAAENAKFEARCIAEGATFWCVNALTAGDLAEYGVHTLEQYKEWQAENDRLCDEKEARKASYFVDDFNYVGSTSHY